MSRFRILGGRLVLAAVVFGFLVVPQASALYSAGSNHGDTADQPVYNPGDEHRFAVFLEGGLSIGGIRHSFNDDALEQFGYHVYDGCEEDGAYFVAGAGKHFGRFSSFLFGEAGRTVPGWLMDAHGPYIPPEVLLRMTVLAGGIELRYAPVRIRFGYGSYSGTAEVDLDYDSTETAPPGSWTTGIEGGHGWHYSVGYHQPVNENLSAGVEWVQHFIDLRLEKNSTSAEPSDQTAVQSEVRFVVTYQFPL